MEFMFPSPGSSGYLILCGGAWMTGASAAAYVVFGLDQRRAEAGLWRIPERTLLWIAGLGGWPGAKLAQWRLHHETRKHSFAGMLNAIALMQFILIVMAVLPQGSLVPVVQTVGGALLGEATITDGAPRARVFGPKADHDLKVRVFGNP